jgi:hypothetical protein
VPQGQGECISNNSFLGFQVVDVTYSNNLCSHVYGGA